MLGNLFERRTLSFQTLWGSGDDILPNSQADVSVDAESAYKIVAFFSAVSLYADTISTLPVDAYIRVDGDRKPYRPKPTWIDQPDIDQTRQAHYGSVVASLLVSGNSYTRIFRDRSGEVVDLKVLDPTKVKVHRTPVGRKYYEYEGKTISADKMIHIVDLAVPGSLTGVSRVDKLKDSLGVAIALQNYAARFFAQGATTNGIIEAPTTMTPQQVKDLADGFDSRHRGWRKAHKTGVLFGGATYKQTTMPNDQAQFLDSRRFAVEEIARAFNIPLHMMGVPGTNTYASVEQANLQWLSHGLRPILEKIEWAYSQLLPSTAFIKFNFNALLRGDLLSRANAYSIMSQAGIISINEVRKLEDLAPIDGGDTPRVPLANVNLNAANLQEEKIKIDMAHVLIADGADPASVLKALGLPPIDFPQAGA
jgi:HK97 family phage portal protein